MNKEEYNELSTYDKIDYDIQMELYQEFNDEIASINDHLGEIYGYNDLKDAEESEMKEEIKKYKKALKEKCEAIDKAIEYINNNQLVFSRSTKEQINEWFNEFYRDLLQILNEGSDV